jgi:hypothetical protein
MSPLWIPLARLDALSRNTAAHLQAWGQREVGNVKLNIAIANSMIFRLDVAQERRLHLQGSCGYENL